MQKILVAWTRNKAKWDLIVLVSDGALTFHSSMIRLPSISGIQFLH